MTNKEVLETAQAKMNDKMLSIRLMRKVDELGLCLWQDPNERTSFAVYNDAEDYVGVDVIGSILHVTNPNSLFYYDQLAIDTAFEGQEYSFTELAGALTAIVLLLTDNSFLNQHRV